MTRDKFRTFARPLEVSINGTVFSAEPKEFKTGNLGFHLGSRVTLVLGAELVQCQVNVLLTLKGGKALPWA